MKEAAHTYHSNAPLPDPDKRSKEQSPCKYSTMHGGFFQVLSDNIRKEVDNMVVRELDKQVYRILQKKLTEKAYMEPMDPTYTVRMHVDGIPYLIKLQPAGKSRIAVLYVQRVHRAQGGKGGELILNKALQSAFLEILLYHILQNIERKTT